MLMTGKDGALYSVFTDALNDQENFDKSVRLVADGGHNMPILQLLNDCGAKNVVVSLGYDRTLVAWSVEEHTGLLYVDK